VINAEIIQSPRVADGKACSEIPFHENMIRPMQILSFQQILSRVYSTSMSSGILLLTASPTFFSTSNGNSRKKMLYYE
jgi:hypothetical protein